MSNKTITWLLIALVVFGGGYYAYTRYNTEQPQTTEDPLNLEELNTTIWASGKVVPAQWATLSAPRGGQIVEIAVAEGRTVDAETILIQLDDTDLRAAVRTAEAALQTAEAELARLQADPRQSEILAAEDSIKMAEAQLIGALAQVEQAQAGVLSAQAGVRQAQAQLAQARLGPTDAQIQASLAQVKQVEKALTLAQSDYDKIAWAGDVGLTPQAIALENATLNYEVAQANHQALLAGPTAQTIAAAQAGVESAEAGVSQAEANIQTALATVAQAEAAVEGAKHQREQVAVGLIRPEDIAVAEAAVNQAQVNLVLAHGNLSKAVIETPFGGTVGTLHIHLGEYVVPGQPLLTIGNLQTLQIETTDLRETDVGRIKQGQVVDLTFDALEDVLLRGRVDYIAVQSTAGQGGTNYTTIITIDEPDIPAELRWGMTAFVNIALVDE